MVATWRGTRLETSRGPYLLDLAGEAEVEPDSVLLTLKLEHLGGMERVGFRCRIARALVGAAPGLDAGALRERLAPWVAHEFEQLREQALKSIRSDGRLFELSFDEERRGPF